MKNHHSKAPVIAPSENGGTTYGLGINGRF